MSAQLARIGWKQDREHLELRIWKMHRQGVEQQHIAARIGRSKPFVSLVLKNTKPPEER